jgi:hypothetical protein
MEGSREEIRAEYAILQTQYEAFDSRALTIKSWSGPLINCHMGPWQNSDALIIAAIPVALSWLKAKNRSHPAVGAGQNPSNDAAPRRLGLFQ